MGLAYLRLGLQKKRERSALFRVVHRVYSTVMGQAIPRPPPPRPGVPGRRRLQI